MEVTNHDFRIDEILGATEGDETDFDHRGASVAHLGRWESLKTIVR
jgi:hypothetical protein